MGKSISGVPVTAEKHTRTLGNKVSNEWVERGYDKWFCKGL
jgi:hypothetical protein